MMKIFMFILDNLSLICSINSMIFGSLKNYRKNFRLKKIMGFKNNKVIVTFSIFFTQMINNSLHELVTVKCLENVKNVMDIGKRIGVEVEIPINDDMSLLNDQQINDLVHIGGPLTNCYVHSFLNKFKGFTFYRKDEDKVINVNHNIINDCIKVTKDKRGRFIRIGNEKYFVDNEKDYLILIRYKELNSRREKRTIHIIFNTHYSSKVNVFKPFIEYTNLLYNEIRKYKDNYFLVIPLDKNTGILEMEKMENKTNELDFFDLSLK